MSARDYPPDPSATIPPGTWIRRWEVPEDERCQCAFHANWPDAPQPAIARHLEPEPVAPARPCAKKTRCDPAVWVKCTPTASDLEIDRSEQQPRISYERRRRELQGDDYKPKYPKEMILPHERADYKGIYKWDHENRMEKSEKTDARIAKALEGAKLHKSKVVRGLGPVGEGEDDNEEMVERVDEKFGDKEVSYIPV